MQTGQIVKGTINWRAEHNGRQLNGELTQLDGLTGEFDVVSRITTLGGEPTGEFLLMPWSTNLIEAFEEADIMTIPSGDVAVEAVVKEPAHG